jgi:hypothetical protein
LLSNLKSYFSIFKWQQYVLVSGCIFWTSSCRWDYCWTFNVAKISNHQHNQVHVLLSKAMSVKISGSPVL